jgi:hypothetical protein
VALGFHVKFAALVLICPSPTFVNRITLADPIFGEIIGKHENAQVLEAHGTKCFEGGTNVRTTLEGAAAAVDDHIG